MAQSSGSMYGNQITALCAQYQQPQASGVLVNQYLYHYCVVEPQEVSDQPLTPPFYVPVPFICWTVCNSGVRLSFQAIAVVFGFLVTIALIIMLVFALKTRQKIQSYGKSNILWKKVKVINDAEEPRDVEEWVSDQLISLSRR